MYSYLAKIMPETRLHKRSRPGIQWLSRRAEHIMHDGRYGGWSSVDGGSLQRTFLLQSLLTARCTLNTTRTTLQYSTMNWCNGRIDGSTLQHIPLD